MATKKKAKLKSAPLAPIHVGWSAAVLRNGEFHNWIGDPQRAYTRVWPGEARSRLDVEVRSYKRAWAEDVEHYQDYEVRVLKVWAHEDV